MTQWSRILLLMQETLVRWILNGGSSCVPWSNGVGIPQLLNLCSTAWELQQLSPPTVTTEAQTPRAHAQNKRSHHNEKPVHRNQRVAPRSPKLEKSLSATKKINT